MKTANSVFEGQGTTIFTVMSSLAAEYDAINLGQGFPDEDGPIEVREAAAKALRDGPNQYPPMMGLPQVRQTVADHHKRFYGLEVDWRSEVMITSGATEALADCFLGLLNDGDEAVILEPAYDSYRPMIERAGATAIAVRLEPPAWELPVQALRDAISEKTKLIVVNTPMNPIGKVFTKKELSEIAAAAIDCDAYVICDEVYEHLVFDGRRHFPLIQFPGMRDRTARIGSAGKTFSLTGWKVGYVTAAPGLMGILSKAHQFNTFTTPPALQLGTATGLQLSDAYFHDLAADLQQKRDVLAQGLAEIGFEVLEAEGTYFLSASYAPLNLDGTAFEVCERLTKEAKVATIPMGAFYENGDGGTVLRFCFSKQDEVLHEAIVRLRNVL
jgi:aspartate/methionine/tyrosine aminotransferase